MRESRKFHKFNKCLKNPQKNSIIPGPLIKKKKMNTTKSYPSSALTKEFKHQVANLSNFLSIGESLLSLTHSKILSKEAKVSNSHSLT